MPSERDLVDRAIMADRHDRLRSALALGLVVVSKWDRADMAHIGGADPAQATRFDTFTDAEIREFNERSAAMLGEYVASMADRRRPSFWLPVIQSLLAADLQHLSRRHVRGGEVRRSRSHRHRT